MANRRTILLLLAHLIKNYDGFNRPRRIKHDVITTGDQHTQEQFPKGGVSEASPSTRRYCGQTPRSKVCITTEKNLIDELQ